MIERNIALIINYPLQEQIDKGNIDLIKVIIDNILTTYDKVYLVCLRDKNSAQQYINVFSERVIIFPTTSRKREIARFLHNKHIVAVRAFATLMSGYFATKIAKKLKVPCIVSVHVDQDLVNKNNGFNPLFLALSYQMERIVLKKADLVPVISTYIKDYVKKLGVPESKIFFHPNFVDEELFKPLVKNDKDLKKHIICVCRLERWKHPEKILEAMPYILKKHPLTSLTFVGTGSMEQAMKQKAFDLDVEEEVIFKGNINHSKELPEIMSRYDVFACGIAGFSLMEALACGLPVVVGNYEWAGEVIKDYQNGFLVQNIEDEKEYAEKINSLLNMPTYCESMSKNNRQLAVERFSKKAFQTRELEIYKKVIK